MDENRHSDPKKAAMLKALEEHLGVVTESIKEVGIARSTHYLWMTEDPEYKQAVDEMNDVVLDFAENKLFALVRDKDTAATIFLLKTKGKKRGYIERTELSGPDGDPITLAFEKVPSFMREIETKQNGIKESPRGIMTKGGFIPQ